MVNLGTCLKLLYNLSEHVGLQIIPINLVLVVVVSYLVGLNTSLAINAISITKKGGGLNSIGAITGLFIACPTCAGTFFAVFVGSATAVTFTVLLTQLQTLIYRHNNTYTFTDANNYSKKNKK